MSKRADNGNDEFSSDENKMVQCVSEICDRRRRDSLMLMLVKITFGIRVCLTEGEEDEGVNNCNS